MQHCCACDYCICAHEFLVLLVRSRGIIVLACVWHVSLRTVFRCYVSFLVSPNISLSTGGAGTSNEVAAAAFDAGVRQGKTCIVVKDVPGFYVNRALCMSAARGASLHNVEKKTGIATWGRGGGRVAGIMSKLIWASHPSKRTWSTQEYASASMIYVPWQ